MDRPTIRVPRHTLALDLATTVRRRALTIKGMSEYWAEFSSKESQDNPLPANHQTTYECKHCHRRFPEKEQPLPGYEPFCPECVAAGITVHYGITERSCSCGKRFFAAEGFGPYCPECLLEKELAG